MKFTLEFNAKGHTTNDLVVYGAFSKTTTEKKKEVTTLVNSTWPKEVKDAFSKVSLSNDFNGAEGTNFHFILDDGTTALAWGLGDKSKLGNEQLRINFANLYKAINQKSKSVSINLDSFTNKSGLEESAFILAEAFELTSYAYNRFLTNKIKYKLENVVINSKEKATKKNKVQTQINRALLAAESINVARGFVNDPPNVLNSEVFAKEVEKDVKKNLKGVKTKILGKTELKKEKMGLFLSVNAGSAFDPKLVHLSYTPKKVTKNTKHIALVGKGLTFDTGGYSLKPSTSMVNMKFDMAGAATVYAAFRAAVLMGANVKVSCFLGMTDNAVNSKATMPDSICTARNGKTVEILNTDAEGRLVLADVLDYAGDQKPDVIIDAATLTGACLVSLGSEVCGLMSNDKKLANSLLKSASATDEYMWELPIIDEFRNDMKSNIADLKNIGSSRFAGTSKAAAFLENFIQEGISWAHLDIAGVGDSQTHKPYCPAKGASGLIVRTVAHYILNAK